MNTETAALPQALAVENVTGKRIVAGFIDIIALIVVFVVFAMLFGESESTSGDEGASFNLALGGGASVVYFLIVLAYYWLLEAATGKTPGKMIMGLKVVTTDGSPYTPMKAFIRNLLRIVDSLPFLYLLGLIVVAASRNKQRIGDMAAGTLVVRS